ncbi:MAG: GAF domain-containing protein [Bacteroidales bacterium]|nr:GAF domain-containing protein [Bacteroidales bacterium]
MNIKIIVSSFVLFFAITINIYGNDTTNTFHFGKPVIKNISFSDYSVSPQVWAITQTDNGLIYIGTNKGVLEYDGQEFRIIETTNNSAVRSLHYHSDGKIYVGAINEFGVLEINASGVLDYRSLSSQMDSISFTNTWSISSNNNGVYFSCDLNSIYRYYNKKLAKLSISPDITRFRIFQINKHIILINEKKEISVIYGDSIISIFHFYNIPISNFRSILLKNENELLISFSLGQLLTIKLKNNTIENALSNKKLIPDNLIELSLTNLNCDVKNLKIYKALKTSKQKFVFATYSGLIICDKNLNIEYLIDKKDGFPSNSLFELFEDKLGNIWVGGQRGLSIVEINLPFRYMDEQNGLEGTVLSLYNNSNSVYIGTTKGIYNIPNKAEYGIRNKYKLNDLSNDYLWTLSFLNLYNNDSSKTYLLASTLYDIVLIDEKKIRSILKLYAANDLCTSFKVQNKIYAGTTYGLYALQVNYCKNNSLLIDCSIDNNEPVINDNILNLAQDQYGNIWVSTRLNGIYYLKINSVNDSIYYESFHYDKSVNLPALKNIYIKIINDIVYLITNNGIYFLENPVQDPKSYTFKPFDELNKNIQSLQEIGNFTSDANNNFWIGSGSTIYKASGNKNKTFDISKFTIEFIPYTNDRTFIFDNEKNLWFGSENKLIIYNPNLLHIPQQKLNLLLRKIQIGDSAIFFGYENKDIIKINNSVFLKKEKIDYADNSLVFTYAYPYFSGTSKIQYSVQLSGYEKEWSHWTKDCKAKYTNLSEGSYSFNVKAKNIDNIETKISRFKFEIAPPWYRSIFAYFGYLFLFVILIFSIIKYYSYQLRIKNIQLEKIVHQRTLEINEQKKEIETSYQNLSLLSKIGQKITQNLTAETISEAVYESINKLMDASIFVIMSYNEKNNRLVVSGGMEKGKKLPEFYYDLDDSNRYAAYCFNKQEKILIGDSSVEYKKYIPNRPPPKAGENASSIIYLPLTLNQEKIGVLTVQSFAKNAYNKSHLDIIKNIGVYTSIALLNAKAISKIENQKKEIEFQTQKLFIANRELEKLSIVANKTTNAVVIMDAKGNFDWVNQGFNDLYETTFDKFIKERGHNVFKLTDDQNVLKELSRCIKDKVALTYEFSTKKKSGETLFIQTTLTPLLDDEGNLKKIIAVDTDISKIKEAENNIKFQKEQIEKSFQNIKLLSEIGKEITTNITFENIITTIYEHINYLMDAPIFAVGLYNPVKNTLDFFGKESSNSDLFKSSDDLTNKQLISVICYNCQETIFINDFSQYKKQFSLYKLFVIQKERQLQSLIYIPLTVKDKKIGVITAQSFEKNAYTNYHLDMLKNIAVYAAIALENANAIHQIEIQKEELEQQKEELQITLNNLEKTQQQLVESAKMAALGNLVAGVAHEINTPIGIGLAASSTLLNKSKTLRELYNSQKMTKPDLEEYIASSILANELIYNNLERTGELVKSFKQVSVDQSTESQRVFNLQKYLTDIVRSLHSKLKQKNITIETNCKENLEINSYPGVFAQIFTNLILNSITHGFKNKKTGEISIDAKTVKNNLIIEYSDNGIGIKEEILPKIYDPFFTTNMIEGTGLGMNIVYNLITQKLKGSIDCISRLNQGVYFIIKLPLHH